MGPFLIGPQHYSASREKRRLSGDCGEPPVSPPLLLLSDKWGVCFILQISEQMVMLAGATRKLGTSARITRFWSTITFHTHNIKIIFSFCLRMRQDICLLSCCVWLLQLTRYLPVLSTLQKTIWFPSLWRNITPLCICIIFLHSFVGVWSGYP